MKVEATTYGLTIDEDHVNIGQRYALCAETVCEAPYGIGGEKWIGHHMANSGPTLLLLEVSVII